MDAASPRPWLWLMLMCDETIQIKVKKILNEVSVVVDPSRFAVMSTSSSIHALICIKSICEIWDYEIRYVLNETILDLRNKEANCKQQNSININNHIHVKPASS